MLLLTLEMKHCHGRMTSALPDQSIKPEMCRTVMNATMFDLPDWSVKPRMQRRRLYHVYCKWSARFYYLSGLCYEDKFIDSCTKNEYVLFSLNVGVSKSRDHVFVT
jgi:hypothetical protein